MTCQSSQTIILVSKNRGESCFSDADGRLSGGKKILTRVAGKDASKQFWKYHNEGILKKYQPKLLVGSLDSKPKAAAPAPKEEKKPAPAKPKPSAAAPVQQQEEPEALDPYGDLVPFADPNWYQSVSQNTILRASIGCLLINGRV